MIPDNYNEDNRIKPPLKWAGGEKVVSSLSIDLLEGK